MKGQAEMSGNNMLKVTFRGECQVKLLGKWVKRSFRWDELVKDEGSARLRARALNWDIVNMEKVG